MKWVSFIPATLRRTVIRAAQLDSEPVYLSGETGSGKSAIARWIHQNSPRSTKPFVICASDDSLSAKIAEAGDGTLVLLELEEFSTDERAMLARMIRTRAYVDPTRPDLRTLVRARVIATGGAPLDDHSAFRPAFHEFQVHLPSLDERGSELEEIVRGLLEEMAHELKRDHVREISPEAMSLLQRHGWRANLRELRNILRYGILRTNGAVIEVGDLPDLRDPQDILVRNREDFSEIERSLTERKRD